MSENVQRLAPRWARNAKTARHLNVSGMSLWRWKRDPKLKFPPAAVINGIEYNDLNLVDDWMRSCTRVAVKPETET
jgi:hypothetical protein